MGPKKLEQLAIVGKNQDGKTELSPILILFSIFSDVRFVEELFVVVRWFNGTHIVPTVRGKT